MPTSTNLLRRAGLAFLGLGAVATALAFTFTLGGTGLPIKWPPGPIPVTVMLGDTTTLSDGSNYNTSARTAAGIWNGQLGSAQLQVTFATGTAHEDNNLNEVCFAANIFGRSFGDGVLAVTTGASRGNERTEADIIFNNSRTWDSYRGNLRQGAVDLQRVAIHELGHLLGLDHPDEKGQSVNAITNSHTATSTPWSATTSRAPSPCTARPGCRPTMLSPAPGIFRSPAHPPR
ncbi:MAG: matrixin family metalloprotease [Oleiharenicola lentus]